ncbi:MAG: Gfo/Idh/MocA family oxidoreductase [Planctomycetota bacterium]|nr:Gfo/Idh/MocA family oxidoreductase [Planctomycetota bacterium]
MIHDLGSSRRSFLKSSAVSAAALSAANSLGALRASSPMHTGGRAQLKIGLVGCGGRGSGAGVQALMADKDNILWAVGDAFADRLQSGLSGITEAMGESGRKDQVQVAGERRFVGLDAIDNVLGSGIDVILLATPPGFRPMQIEKSVKQGVHIFAEKPVATDAPGLRRVLAACAEAKQKNLTFVSGLCYRYHDGRREIVKRLQDGAIGEIQAIHGNYLTGELWNFPRKPTWTDMELQLRNWLYYPWLSGDMIAEQHIHSLDVMAWIKKDVYPTKCYSLGGRQKRTEAQYGVIYDHFSTVYEWADGTRGFSYCRQQDGTYHNVNEYVLGTEGKADVFAHQITGKTEWQLQGKMGDMYQNEHDEMFAAIRAGKQIDNSHYMCESTLMAIMGRMAAYTGQEISREKALNSTELLMPNGVTLDMPTNAMQIAVPGLTKFS